MGRLSSRLGENPFNDIKTSSMSSAFEGLDLQIENQKRRRCKIRTMK